MHLHILGISGTFMGGIALLAKQSGHSVSGSDKNVYPPMSTQLKEQGIQLIESDDPVYIDSSVDCVIVGNVIKRGNPSIEYVLNKGIPYLSGPEWLAKNILADRHVLAVSGTHGKTTTTSILAWMLQEAGLEPGFLIGGVPENFGISARLGKHPYFVIEADEYDSAFFDKRPKFIHYHPQTLILNNLEFDHADIFSNLEAIKQQFHYLVRTIPGKGLIVCNQQDQHLQEVLSKGCWTKVTTFGQGGEWEASLIEKDGSAFTLSYQGKVLGTIRSPLLGKHNMSNTLAAIAAAHHVNAPLLQIMQALSTFKNVKRRLELKGEAKGVTIYDDFAHHPTAIATTLAGLRAKIGETKRIIAVLEFGSYTMRSGVHKDKMQEALSEADMVICKNTETDWGLAAMLAPFKQQTALYGDVDALVAGLLPTLQAGDHVLIMSNSVFGGIHQKLLDGLQTT
jgi:UDP-N-acetylmuramate: L-alanyl-gamma-D-glutamyl-meso-diaminopimelate ligase